MSLAKWALVTLGTLEVFSLPVLAVPTLARSATTARARASVFAVENGTLRRLSAGDQVIAGFSCNVNLLEDEDLGISTAAFGCWSHTKARVGAVVSCKRDETTTSWFWLDERQGEHLGIALKCETSKHKDTSQR